MSVQFRLDYALSREQKNKSGGELLPLDSRDALPDMSRVFYNFYQGRYI